MNCTEIVIHDERVTVKVKDLYEGKSEEFTGRAKSLISVKTTVRSKQDMTLSEVSLIFADEESFREFANQIVDGMGALLGDSVHWGPDRDDDLLAEDPHDERKLPYKVCTKCGYASETDAKYCRACSRLLP